MSKKKAAVAAMLAIATTGCVREGDIFETGILTAYTACPAVAIAAPTGDITLFDPPSSRDAAAIDVVATMTNVRQTCTETADQLVTNITFDVVAQRRNPSGAREVVLPYYATVVQGGENVASKQVGRVGLRFEDGQVRASASGSATSQVLRAAATLPEDIRNQITRRRRAGEADAAVDPLSDPAVRAAVQRARFEVFVGFALDPEQLRYNATR